MTKHADFFNGVNLYNQDIINFKPHQVSSLPLSPFLGQMVFLDTIDGSHAANQTYQWDGTEWSTITHHDLTVAAGSTDYLEITGHEISIKNLALGQVTVDNTYSTLAAWITGSSYDGSQLQEGDVLILQAATDGQKTYIHKSGSAGDATDFVAMFDELTAAEVRGYFTSGEGTSYDSSDGSFDVGHDHSTININGSNELFVVDAGITEAKLATGAVTETKIGADAVTPAKLHATVAGAGLVQNGTDESLEVNVDDSTIEVNADVVQVKDAGITTAKLADDSVTAAKINADVAGEALVPNGTTGALDVNVDDSTIEITTDALNVKDLGITEAKLASAVTTKLNDNNTALIGDGAATSFTVTHNKGTFYLLVGVANTSDNYKEVYPTITKPTNNTVLIDFGAEVPTTNQYAVTIKAAL